MTRQQIMEKLEDIFREQFDDDEIVLKDETTASDIEDWDSLAHMELISTIEGEFAMRFSMGEINSFANVGQMADCIQKHLA